MTALSYRQQEMILAAAPTPSDAQASFIQRVLANISQNIPLT